MKLEKISFSVEDVRIVKDERNDSQFAILEVDAFASGSNLHNMYVSEETLKNKAFTILNKPFVFDIDKRFDDLGTHTNTQVPGGFVPADSPIKYKQTSDGRTMMSVMVLIWKRYCGKLIDYMRRDGGTKGVSVEMELFDQKPLENGLTELLDYCFAAITGLGDMITPAVSEAKAVMQFALQEQQEYQHDYNAEFGIDMTIPEEVKFNAKKGLEFYQKYNFGGTSVGLSVNKFLLDSNKIDDDRFNYLVNYFAKQKIQFEENPPSSNYITYLLFGGTPSFEWIKQLSKKIDNKIRFGEVVTMPYKKISEINPALKGIKPEITVAQANEIARQADAIGSDKDKNGWAIAISNFKKNHKVVDGHWEKMSEDFATDLGSGDTLKVDKGKEKLSNTAWGSVDKTALMHKVLNAKNYKSLVHDVYMIVESGWEDHPSSSLKYPVMQLVGDTLVYNSGGLSSALGYAKKENETAVVSKINGIRKKMGLDNPEEKETMAMQEEEKEKMATDMPKEEEKETPQEEKQETPEEEKKEKEEGVEKPQEKEKMSSDAYLDVNAVLAMLQEETDEYKCLVEEMAKPEDQRNYAMVCSKMFAKMCKMQASCKDMETMCGTYMAEIEQLRKFKQDVESKDFQMQVASTLAEVSNCVPQEEMASLQEKAKEFSLDNIDAWKNLVKARAFNFAIKEDTKEPKEKKYGLPFADTTTKSTSIWTR